MNDKDISDEKIMIEENLYGFSKYLASGRKGKILKNNPLCIYTGYPLSNRIVNTNFNKININNIIKNVIELYKKIEISPIWVVTPFSKPDTLENHLVKNNFKKVEIWTGMITNLSDIKYNIMHDNNIVIKKVNSDEQLKDWSKILTINYTGNDKFVPDAQQMYIDIGYERDDCSYYLAYYNNKAASTCLAFYNAGVIGIYRVSTLNEYRYKGIGSLITYTALSDAIDRGFKYSILHASEKAKELYKKMGFKESYIINAYRQ